MGGILNTLVRQLHLLIVFLTVWLIATSPWISMLGKMPREPGLLDYAHVGAGLAGLILAVVYFFDCVRGGSWRLNFPWLSSDLRVVVDDLRGLFRGRLPAAESGGLFGALGGLTLLAFLATALTGAVWWWTEGTSAAMDWRAHHLVAVRFLIATVVLHTVAAALHVLDFVRD
jgi:cytochrome b561